MANAAVARAAAYHRERPALHPSIDRVAVQDRHIITMDDGVSTRRQLMIIEHRDFVL